MDTEIIDKVEKALEKFVNKAGECNGPVTSKEYSEAAYHMSSVLINLKAIRRGQA